MQLNADGLHSSLTLTGTQNINQVSHLISSVLNQCSLAHNKENNEGKIFY